MWYYVDCCVRVISPRAQVIQFKYYVVVFRNSKQYLFVRLYKRLTVDDEIGRADCLVSLKQWRHFIFRSGVLILC